MSSYAIAQEPEKRTITAAEFKAKCLKLMDEVNEKPLTLIITKRGKPVMQVSAPTQEEKPFRSIIGRSPGVKILGDIVSPLPEEWTLPAFARDKRESKLKKGKKK